MNAVIALYKGVSQIIYRIVHKFKQLLKIVILKNYVRLTPFPTISVRMKKSSNPFFFTLHKKEFV